MTIGTNIKKLRRERNITQEQLAEFLNVSAQAVSRWETETALPDIAQLPALASIFNVSSDTLLGIDVDTKEARIDAIAHDAWENYGAKGLTQEALGIIRNALKEYPDSYKLMRDHMVYIGMTAPPKFSPDTDVTPGTPASPEHLAALRECVGIGEKILAGCTDDSIRFRALEYMPSMYATLGEQERALELANSFSDYDKGEILSNVYRGDEQYRHWQKQIYRMCERLTSRISILPYITLDNKQNPYDCKEAIGIVQKAIDICNVLCDNEDYGPVLIWRVVPAHCSLAILNMQVGNPDAALEQWQLTAKHLAAYAANANENNVQTSPLFRGYDFGKYTGVAQLVGEVLRHMSDIIFDPVRDNPIFREAEAAVKSLATTPA